MTKEQDMQRLHNYITSAIVVAKSLGMDTSHLESFGKEWNVDLVAPVLLTKEDCLNVTKWWTAASIAVEAGVRTKLSGSEYATMAKIEGAKKELGDYTWNL